MPLHDWKPNISWMFQSFHLHWMVRIKEAITRSLPADFYPLHERNFFGLKDNMSDSRTIMPRSKREETDDEWYSRRKNIIGVRHHTDGDRVVAAVIVTTIGDTASGRRCRALLKKIHGLFDRGIHVMLVDVFPATVPSPNGVHSAIWQRVNDSAVAVQLEETRAAVSYECGKDAINAFVEPLTLGATLPDMPLFIGPGRYVTVPVGKAFEEATDALPVACRERLEGRRK